MKRIVKWLKSPAGISVGSTVLAFILTVIYDFLKNKPVLTTILIILKAIVKFFSSILNFQLKIWWVLLGIAFVIFILYIIYKVLEIKYSTTNLPPFMNYTEDIILHWSWKWVWEKQYDGKYDIEYLRPICPRCNTPLICNYFSYRCPRCNHEAHSDIPDLDTVKIMIMDNVEKASCIIKSVKGVD